MVLNIKDQPFPNENEYLKYKEQFTEKIKK